MLGKLTGLPRAAPWPQPREHCHSGDKCRSQAQHTMAQETASCRSQFLLRGKDAPLAPASPFTPAPTYSFHRHTGLLFLVVSPTRLWAPGRQSLCQGCTGLTASPPPGPLRCLASSRACPSPLPASRLQLSGVWGLQQHTEVPSATTGAESLRLAHPTCCLTCFWPAWWPAGSVGLGAPVTSSRSGCRCKQSHFRKLQEAWEAPGVWAPVTLSWLPSLGFG